MDDKIGNVQQQCEKVRASHLKKKGCILCIIKANKTKYLCNLGQQHFFSIYNYSTIYFGISI